jgi:hypothetical protein
MKLLLVFLCSLIVWLFCPEIKVMRGWIVRRRFFESVYEPA